MTPTRHPHLGEGATVGVAWVPTKGTDCHAQFMTATQPSESAQLIDVHDMVVVHRLFRRELIDLSRLIRAVAPGDVERAAVVAGHARLVLAGLHLHHTGEDDLLWPKLLERAAPSADLVAHMQSPARRHPRAGRDDHPTAGPVGG